MGNADRYGTNPIKEVLLEKGSQRGMQMRGGNQGGKKRSLSSSNYFFKKSSSRRTMDQEPFSTFYHAVIPTNRPPVWDGLYIQSISGDAGVRFLLGLPHCTVLIHRSLQPRCNTWPHHRSLARIGACSSS